MTIAIIDPTAGVSGDMLLGAILDAGVDPDWLQRLPGRLNCGDVEVRLSRVTRASVSAAKVDFVIPGGDTDIHHHDGHHGRHISDLVNLVGSLPVSEWVRERAVRAFRLIGEAEGKIHGVDPGQVHLHEVGAVDAILDIVGVIEGFERLGITEVYNFPVGLGKGSVQTDHGKLPVPAPATAELLCGFEVSSPEYLEGEAVTPTGAALLRVLSSGTPPERWRMRATSWGAGTRDPAGYPNAVRLILADKVAEAGTVEVLVTDIDDIQPEYIAPLRDALTKAGALDCVTWLTHGKKGRPTYRVEVIAPPSKANAVAEALFKHSTTGGIRRWETTRHTLDRSILVVEVAPQVQVGVKVLQAPDGPRLKAEFDDVVSAADTLGTPALDVAARAERLAEDLLAGRDS